MKKRNSKGFTLIEVLGVLIILALLILLISKPVMNMINNSRNEISASQEKSILNAAEKWSVDNSDRFDDIEGNAIQIALDVVLILDLSVSMNANMMNSMIDATNSAMAIFESDINRFGVVTFSNVVNIFMSLDKYTSETNIFLKPKTGTGRLTTSSDLKKNGTSYYNAISQGGWTYTQGGIYSGSKMLLDTRTDNTQRIPVIILLTDGAPNYHNRRPDHSGTYQANDYTNGAYYTIKAANYYKPKIKQHYNSNPVYFYTVGFNLPLGGVEEMLLNPKKDKIEKGLSSQRNGNYYKVSSMLKNDDNTLNTFSYADKAFIGQMDASELKDLFSQIANEVVEATKITQVCVTVQDLYDGGYLSKKDINLASDKAASQYILMSYNEPTNQYSYTFAKTDKQIADCKKLLEENTTP